ncbi:hypothetical protein, partial [Chlorogloeopsis fritschii]|uniref:hypothetical protein n=1 Tax=Chlorogloeopsis fritschii TaxID=1124 RepID=UPI003C6CC028
AVCIKCTEISRPGSFRTTVCTRYQGSPIDYAPPRRVCLQNNFLQKSPVAKIAVGNSSQFLLLPELGFSTAWS